MTPKSFGSLILILPVIFSGGNLRVWHDKDPWTITHIESDTNVYPRHSIPTELRVEYIALRNDVDSNPARHSRVSYHSHLHPAPN